MLFLAATLGAAPPVMFRGDPAHSGVYQSDAPSLSAAKWTFKTRGKVVSSPVVADGIVYVGSNDRFLYAIDAETGAQKWRFAAGGGVSSSPAVADGVAYFASIDGFFYAVDTASGKLKWKFKTAGEQRFTAPGIHGLLPRTERMPDPYDVFLSSPAIVNGVVYFGSGDHHVYALNSETGDVKWKFVTGDTVHASPAVADGVVYVGSWDRYMYALAADSGSVIWKFQTGGDNDIYNQIGIASSASIANETIYFGCRDGHAYAVDAKTGTQKWSVDNNKGWTIASPAIHKGVVYFPTSDGTRFKAVEAATGKIVFNLENKAVSFSSAAIAGETAYYGTSDGWLHAVDLKTGKIVAEFQTEGNKQNASKYIDKEGHVSNAIYTEMTLDGAVVGLDKMYSLGSIMSSPAIVNGILYVGSTDGYVYAVK